MVASREINEFLLFNRALDRKNSVVSENIYIFDIIFDLSNVILTFIKQSSNLKKYIFYTFSLISWVKFIKMGSNGDI